MDIGDWTTWDGLAEENSFEHESRWGAAPAKAQQPAAAAGWAKPAGFVRRVPTPAEKKGFKDAKLARGIDKKKKKNRGGGLMKVVDETVEEEAVQEEEEVAAEPSPYIVKTTNPFAALADMEEQDEDMEESAEAKAAAEAAAKLAAKEAAKAEAAKAKEAAKAEAAAAKLAAKEAAAKAKAEAAAAKEAAKEAAAAAKENDAVAPSPIVRRTRNAIKGISKTMNEVVAAVSPMLERSRSEGGLLAGASNLLSALSGSNANVAVEPAQATAPVKAAPAAGVVRRSSRLRN